MSRFLRVSRRPARPWASRSARRWARAGEAVAVGVGSAFPRATRCPLSSLAPPPAIAAVGSVARRLRSSFFAATTVATGGGVGVQVAVGTAVAATVGVGLGLWALASSSASACP